MISNPIRMWIFFKGLSIQFISKFTNLIKMLLTNAIVILYFNCCHSEMIPLFNAVYWHPINMMLIEDY